MDIMKKAIPVLTAAVMISACSDIPENLTDSTVSDAISGSSSGSLSSTAEIGENGLVYDIPENAFELDLSQMKHMMTTENTVIGKPSLDGVYETDVSYSFTDLNQHRDELGKEYLGEKYNSSCWSNIGHGTQALSRYVSEDFKGEFQVDNFGKLVYVDDIKNLQSSFIFKEEINDDGTKYLLADGSSMLYCRISVSADAPGSSCTHPR